MTTKQPLTIEAIENGCSLRALKDYARQTQAGRDLMEALADEGATVDEAYGVLQDWCWGELESGGCLVADTVSHA